MIARLAILVLGVFTCATAVIFIKACNTHPVLLSGLRLLVAAIALTPLFLRDLKRHRDEYTSKHFKASVLPGLILGIHFISWIMGARLAPAANASLIVNFVPVAMPFFMFFMIRERVSRQEILGTVVAFIGVGLLSVSDFNIDAQFFKGDVLCFLSMLFFCYYLALARKNRDFATLWLYVVPLYYVAGIFCLLLSLCFVNPIQPYPSRDILLILALGIIPTVIGHSILNYSLKHLRGQVVSLVNMGQFIFAGIMAFIFFHEIPAPAFYIACVLLIAGSTLAIYGHNSAGAS